MKNYLVDRQYVWGFALTPSERIQSKMVEVKEVFQKYEEQKEARQLFNWALDCVTKNPKTY